MSNPRHVRNATVGKLLLCLLTTVILLPIPAAGQRTVVDFAGRHINVPRQIRKVYCTNPACALMVYTLAPDRLLAWPSPGAQFSAKEKSFLPATAAALPLSNGGNVGALNIEEMMKLHPDLVLFMDSSPNATTLSSMRQVEQQTHIPTYYFNMSLDGTPQVYERLGALLGVETRGADLARYCRSRLNEIESKVRTIPQARRPRVYYAAGLNGLQTMPAGEDHIAAIETAGGINVAQVPLKQGVSQVSLEQVLMWKPQIILTYLNHYSPNPFYAKTVWQDPLWRETPAVRNHAVYEIPAYPFGWASPPASVNRVLGIQWLAKLFYPGLFHYDLRKETKGFYAKFYHKQLTDRQVDELLVHSLR